MLAGPPRLVSVVCMLLLLMLGWSYTRLTWTSSAPLLRFESPSPPMGVAPARDPLDFSIPLKFKDGVAKPPGSNYSWVVVVPKTKKEDLGWFEKEIPEAQLVVYEVDNPKAKHKIPKNKGREAMVYLSYMIDNYDELPDTTIFMHAHQRAWHNNLLLGQDAAPMIRRLNHERVARMGYMNVRCHHEPGCPDWIHMDRPGGDFDFFRKPEEIHWRRHIWEEIHPGAPIPFSLSGVCCAQFALSRDRIQQVPIERLRHYRQWLIKTKMDDQYSGRVFEYIWHYIFTGHEVYCPAQNTCYCDGYGVCFGGRQNYEDYWEKSSQRDKDWDALEGFNRQVDEAKKKGSTKVWSQKEEWKMEELRDSIIAADEWLGRTRDEAFMRGESAELRAAETENHDSSKIWKYAPKPEDYEAVGLNVGVV
ncbi:hypothetical protein P280DRAFT_490571 [Massarina eburnea CBS 473.64]|uniref:Uncharacterized protein n=1 Tax=Massarina eburnea CBS 473.64 TaxID=1395130 RepID=A0A6A6S1B8_9PLEO|nr:hypothetical protein P280DRAFT_490571 [Massarina eburnea CBS 473.64]